MKSLKENLILKAFSLIRENSQNQCLQLYTDLLNKNDDAITFVSEKKSKISIVSNKNSENKKKKLPQWVFSPKTKNSESFSKRFNQERKKIWLANKQKSLSHYNNKDTLSIFPITNSNFQDNLKLKKTKELPKVKPKINSAYFNTKNEPKNRDSTTKLKVMELKKHELLKRLELIQKQLNGSLKTKKQQKQISNSFFLSHKETQNPQGLENRNTKERVQSSSKAYRKYKNSINLAYSPQQHSYAVNFIEKMHLRKVSKTIKQLQKYKTKHKNQLKQIQKIQRQKQRENQTKRTRIMLNESSCRETSNHNKKISTKYVMDYSPKRQVKNKIEAMENKRQENSLKSGETCQAEAKIINKQIGDSFMPVTSEYRQFVRVLKDADPALEERKTHCENQFI